MPTGIGNDDARILTEVSQTPVNPGITGHVTLIASDDSGLIRATAAMLKNRPWLPTQTAVVSQLRRNDYTAICLAGVRESYEMYLSDSHEVRRTMHVPYYNYILKRMWSLPEKTVEALRDMIPGNWRKVIECRLYYDVPNLERGLERTRFRSETNTVVVSSGGGLTRKTLDSLPHGYAWAENPISEIAKWDDFSMTKRRVIHVKDVRIKAAAYVARPEQLSSTRKISLWMDSFDSIKVH